jgi:hypothetical protein
MQQYKFLTLTSAHLARPIILMSTFENIVFTYCRFQVTFQRAVPKFVANLPIDDSP